MRTEKERQALAAAYHAMQEERDRAANVLFVFAIFGALATVAIMGVGFTQLNSEGLAPRWELWAIAPAVASAIFMLLRINIGARRDRAEMAAMDNGIIPDYEGVLFNSREVTVRHAIKRGDTPPKPF